MKILKSIIFILILCILIELIPCLLFPNDNVKKYGIYNITTHSILGEDENTIDVVAIGDSLIYSSISPMEIWNSYGYTVFDSATPAQIISDTYENLKIAIQSQKPKIVLLEASVLFRDPKKRHWDERIATKVQNFIPMIKYHNNWKKIFLSKSSWIDINKGYKYITKVEPSKKKDYMKYSDKTINILKNNLEYFEKIINLCDKNNVKLVLVSMPTQKNWNYSKHVKALEIAKEKNIEFIDLNMDSSLNIDWEKETKDKGVHLNYLGAKKVSKYIGNYLKSTNLLVDHRNDPDYNDWNIAYKKYQISLDNN